VCASRSVEHCREAYPLHPRQRIRLVLYFVAGNCITENIGQGEIRAGDLT